MLNICNTHNQKKPHLIPASGNYFVYDDYIYDLFSSDTSRNSSYKIAINALVKDKVVLDIGTGRDALLARFCLEAGAKKVFAIEYIESSYKSACSLVEKLGLQNDLIIMHGESTKINLPEKVDVIVSEILGMIGSMEGAIAVLNDARRRHLKNNGQLIPCKCTTYIAAVKFPATLWDDCFDDAPSINCTQRIFKEVGHPFDIGVCIENFPTEHLISDAGVFESLDFTNIIDEEHVEDVNLTILKDDVIDGFLLYLNVETIENTFINGLENNMSWVPLYLPIFDKSVRVRAGDHVTMKCRRLLSEDRINLDYLIDGEVVYKDGTSRLPFSYSFKYLNQPYKGNLFYKKLFETLESRNHKLWP